MMIKLKDYKIAFAIHMVGIILTVVMICFDLPDIVSVIPFIICSTIRIIYEVKKCKCPHCESVTFKNHYWHEFIYAVKTRQNSFTCPYCEKEIEIVKK